jgi:hypothetical protein
LFEAVKCRRPERRQQPGATRARCGCGFSCASAPLHASGAVQLRRDEAQVRQVLREEHSVPGRPSGIARGCVVDATRALAFRFSLSICLFAHHPDLRKHDSSLSHLQAWADCGRCGRLRSDCPSCLEAPPLSNTRHRGSRYFSGCRHFGC